MDKTKWAQERLLPEVYKTSKLRNLEKLLPFALAVLLAFTVFACGGNKTEAPLNQTGICYIKGERLMYADENNKPTEVACIDPSLSPEDLLNSAFLSQDGSTLFFTQDMDSQGRFALCCFPVAEIGKKPTVIGANIGNYAVTGDGQTVVYSNHDGLFRFHKSELETIDSPRSFVLSGDGNKVVYIRNYKLCMQEAGKETQVLCEEQAVVVKHASKDLADIFFGDSSSRYTLYRLLPNGQVEEVAEDVCKVIKVFETGEAYYFTEGTATGLMKDFIEDDMWEIDQSMQTPEELPPLRPEEKDYSSYSNYHDDYTTFLRELRDYGKVHQDYYEKCKRDYLRGFFEESIPSDEFQSLWYYDGKTSKLVAELCFESLNSVGESPIIVFRCYDEKTAPKLKISEFNLDSADYSFLVDDEFIRKAEYYSTSFIAVKDKPTRVGLNVRENDHVFINKKGDRVFIQYSMDLYQVDVNGESEPTLFQERYGECFFDDNDQLVYLATGKKHYDLYIEELLIDSGVVYASFQKNDKSGNLVYLDNCQSGYNWVTYGNLKVYADGKLTEIAQEVKDYYSAPDGKIYFVTLDGELRVFSNGEIAVIDSEVDRLIPLQRDSAV